jgi:predicted permease
MFEAFRQDLRHAFRHLRRSPTFTLGAMLTLGLGIGASAAVFSALNALVLRPAPIKDPSGLIGVWPINAQGQRTSTLAPLADLLQDGPLESVCAYGNNSAGVEANGIPVYATVEIVTHQCFATLGVPPLLGRAFTPEEAPASRPGIRVVVIGYDFWQKVFGGAPDVVGRSFQTDADPVTIIGVMPRGFRGLRVDDGVDIIAPFGTVIPTPANRPFGLASHILGRLRPGVTLEAARAELVSRWPPMMDRVIPTTPSPAEQRRLRDVTIRVDAVGTGFSILRTRYEQPLWIGSTLTLGLLVLACVNIGGLALSRVAARGGELAMRTALGASRLRLARQLVLEILAVAGAGTILGIGVAWVAVKPIASALPFGGLQPTLNVAPDLRVVFVTALAGLVTGLLASLLPVWLASRTETLQLHSDRTVAATSRPGRVLLVAQVALSVALLMTAGLLTRSLYLLFNNYPGFDGTQILSARLRPLPGAYRDPAFNNGLNYYPLLLERITALPGVRSVGYARAFGNADRDDTGRAPIGFVGTPPSDLTAQFDVVSPGFFETTGIPILQGRGPRWSDTPQAPRVAVVSASLARALGGDVIGKHVWFAFGADPQLQNVEIVGVVGDASLGNLRSPAPAVFYCVATQLGPYGFYSTLQIAASRDPWQLAGPLQDTLRGLGREYAYSITTLDKRLQQNAINERMGATLATPVAALAALLAFVGIYSLFAYAVVRRTREIGVRLAVGASPGAVLRMVLRESVTLTAIGVALGIPAGIMASRWLRALLFGVSESDPMVAASVTVFFLVLTIAAVLIPARRAARLDPVAALRAE